MLSITLITKFILIYRFSSFTFFLRYPYYYLIFHMRYLIYLYILCLSFMWVIHERNWVVTYLAICFILTFFLRTPNIINFHWWLPNENILSTTLEYDVEFKNTRSSQTKVFQILVNMWTSEYDLSSQGFVFTNCNVKVC